MENNIIIKRSFDKSFFLAINLHDCRIEQIDIHSAIIMKLAKKGEEDRLMETYFNAVGAGSPSEEQIETFNQRRIYLKQNELI